MRPVFDVSNTWLSKHGIERVRIMSRCSAMAVMLLFASACNQVSPPSGPIAYPSVPATSRLDSGFFASDRPINPPGVFEVDKRVAKAVRQMLDENPALASHSRGVRVQVAKGIVTLRGTVPSEDAKSQIIEQIRDMPGVGRVDDRLIIARS